MGDPDSLKGVTWGELGRLRLGRCRELRARGPGSPAPPSVATSRHRDVESLLSPRTASQRRRPAQGPVGARSSIRSVMRCATRGATPSLWTKPRRRRGTVGVLRHRRRQRGRRRSTRTRCTASVMRRSTAGHAPHRLCAAHQGAATGEGVSYGYTHRAAADTRVALVTAATRRESSGASATHLESASPADASGHRRVAMDVCVVDIGDAACTGATTSVFFGGRGARRARLSGTGWWTGTAPRRSSPR